MSGRAPGEEIPLGSLRCGDRVALRNVTRGAGVVQRLDLALSTWDRARGLLGRPPLGPGEGMLLLPCNAVHMFMMRQAIDVAFLSAGGEVLRVVAGLRPWRVTAPVLGALATLELWAGGLAATGTAVGDRLAAVRC